MWLLAAATSLPFRPPPPPLTCRWLRCSRCASSSTPQPPPAVTRQPEQGTLQTSFASAAKANAKTAYYGSVIVVGLGITALIAYTIVRELFSGDSAVSLFQAASAKCVAHEKLQDMLGQPIKAFGEESRRGRRSRVASMAYVDENGCKGMRVQFHLKGIRAKATAEVDARQDEPTGAFKIRYIVAYVEDLFRTTVIVEDNRHA